MTTRSRLVAQSQPLDVLVVDADLDTGVEVGRQRRQPSGGTMSI